ncbi:MAG: carboxymuconolactone decarboxylase family protein [Gammaproteobacteria bacterium]
MNTNMHEFKVHDLTNAPTESRVDLEKIKQHQGHIHNVFGVMAESPCLLKGYVALKDIFEKTTLNKQERKIVLLTASRENGSAYSTAVQTVAAEKHEVSADVIEAIRAGKHLDDQKLETLHSFTAKVINSRGQVSESDIKSFLDAGYTRANILEIVLAAGMVTLTNYTNLIAKTPLDKQFEARMWKKAS